MRKAWLVSCLTVLAALLQGCAVKRVLRITSDPSGATVRIDDEVIGTTPLVMPFVHYGVRRITLYKDGFHTSTVRRRFDPPFYGRFPLDILSEVLIPIGWKDRLRYHVDLVEGQDLTDHPSLRSVIQRSAYLRKADPNAPVELPEVIPTELPTDSDPVGSTP